MTDGQVFYFAIMAGLAAALQGYCEQHGWQYADWKTS